MTGITPAVVRAALLFIPPNLPRDDWARLAMAIKSEFPDADGFELFDEWSATAEGYKSKDVVATWRSIKAAGGVGIGTLLHEAKARGYVQTAADPMPDAATFVKDARAARKRAAQRASARRSGKRTKSAALRRRS